MYFLNPDSRKHRKYILTPSGYPVKHAFKNTHIHFTLSYLSIDNTTKDSYIFKDEGSTKHISSEVFMLSAIEGHLELQHSTTFI